MHGQNNIKFTLHIFLNRVAVKCKNKQAGLF